MFFFLLGGLSAHWKYLQFSISQHLKNSLFGFFSLFERCFPVFTNRRPWNPQLFMQGVCDRIQIFMEVFCSCKEPAARLFALYILLSLFAFEHLQPYGVGTQKAVSFQWNHVLVQTRLKFLAKARLNLQSHRHNPFATRVETLFWIWNFWLFGLLCSRFLATNCMGFLES